MAEHVRAKWQLLLTEALDDVQPITLGYSADRYIADSRDLGNWYDPVCPPTAAQWWWANVAYGTNPMHWGSGALLVPELRGAIMAPFIQWLPSDSYLVPAHPVTVGGELIEMSWADPDDGPSDDLPWTHKTHTDLGSKVAVYTPSTTVAGDGCIMTAGVEPVDRGFVFAYRMSTPTAATDGSWPTETSGVTVGWGAVGGVPQGSLCMPNPVLSGDDNAAWRLLEWTDGTTYSVIDSRPAPSSGISNMADPGWEWVMVVPVCGRLCIWHSRREGVWVYAPQNGYTIRAGRPWLNFYGCRGVCQYGWVLFPDEVEIVGPTLTYDDAFTKAASVLVKAVTKAHDPTIGADATYVGSWNLPGGHPVGQFYGEAQVTITNASPQDQYGGVDAGHRYTPLIFSVQEVHEPVLTAPVTGILDLAAYIDNIQYSSGRDGRGATCTIKLRNFVEAGGLYSELYGDGMAVGILTDDLYGCHRYDLRVSLQSNSGDTAFEDVFVGYPRRVVHSWEGPNPFVTLELVDRMFILENTPMVLAPDFAGWDAKAALTLCLNIGYVHDDEMVWPADYGSPFAPVYMFQEAASATKFSQETTVAEAISAICDRCWMGWKITREGKVEFFWRPYAATASTFDLDEAETDVEDLAVQPIETVLDYGSARTVAYGLGKDSWGFEAEAFIHAGEAALVTPGTSQFIGRHLWGVRIEPDNPAPALIASNLLNGALQSGRQVSWRELARATNRWPGTIGTFKGSHYGLPSGTTIMTTECSFSWSARGGDARLWLNFGADAIGSIIA